MNPDLTLPSEVELASSRTFKERGRNTSARWFILGPRVFHSRTTGHLENSIHSPEYIESTHHLEEVEAS